MQILLRILKPKYWAVALWIMCFVWLVLVLSVFYVYPKQYNLVEVQQQTDDLAQLARIREVISDIKVVKEKIPPQYSSSASVRPLFPLALAQEQQDVLNLEGLVIFQSGSRLMAVINGQTVTKGQSLSSGQRVTKITPRAVTLQTADGNSRTYGIDNSYAPRSAAPSEEEKK